MRFVSRVLAVGALVVGGCGQSDEPPVQRTATAAEQTYQLCTQCHGSELGGKPEIAAPAIAGLPAWYVEAQLHKFKSGVRGTHFDDIAGMRMRPMAMSLTDGDIEQVAKVVESTGSTGAHGQGHEGEAHAEAGHGEAHGDAERGKTLFATCTACHGADGRGNQQLNAPPLHQADGWYLLTQLKNFKHGVRGANPQDTTGGQMRPMAQGLSDEQAMRDVIAYIDTL